MRKLSVYLITYRFDNVTAFDLDSTAKPAEESEETAGAAEGETANITQTDEPRPLIQFDVSDLLHLTGTTLGEWTDGKASFTSVAAHSVAFVGLADIRYPLHRGYVAIDNVAFTTGPCDSEFMF